MKNKKKIVDLIHVEPQKNEAQLIKDYKFSLSFWKDQLRSLQESHYEEHFDSSAPDVHEILGMRKFIGKFIQSRLDWITNSVNDPERRRKYLSVFPPFQQKGGVKTMLLHFFQIEETSDKKSIIYHPKNNIEKEISVLWDIYKLRKTIESISTMRRSLDTPDPFPSFLSVEERKNCLDSLKKVFQLLFQMCIKKEFQKEMYQSISIKHITPEIILQRVEENISYVYPHVIKKFDYRNHFFHVYYLQGMKAKIGGKMKEFRYNFLDFELIKQEFLIDWVGKKLKNNPDKENIYSRYSIGGKKLNEIIAENPAAEIESLKSLPSSVFNDLMAEINNEVDDNLKTAVDPCSENEGEFAEATQKFNKARNIGKLSLNKLKAFVKKTVKKIPEDVEQPKEIKQEIVPPVVEETTYEVIKIKDKQIDYPFFLRETKGYTQKLSLLRVKMGSQYTQMNKGLNKFFNSVSESAVIKRRTPKHEVTYSHLIKEKQGDNVTTHLLILGAEIKAKQLGMAYNASGQSAFSYTSFFVYGNDTQDNAYGDIVDTRNARGVSINIFDFVNGEVQKKAVEFFDMVMKK